MQQPRKLPQIGRGGPQSFGTAPRPPIPSPVMLGQHPMQQQSEVSAVATATQELALEIYAQLAVDHIRRNQEPDPSTLQTLARQSQSAALAYFQTLGVQFDG